MKKNAFILAGFCALGLSAWQVQASNVECPSAINNNVGDNEPTGYEKIIELKGDLLYSTNPNAIVAGISCNSIYLHFNQSFGNVGISVYNEAGNLVYGGMVDTSVQQTVIIPIMGSSSGIFSVALDNAFGCAEGDFERGNP